MEFRELLSRNSLPNKQKISEEEALKLEESYFSNKITNVKKNIYNISFINNKIFLKKLILLIILNKQLTQKSSNFIALGFENKEEDENEEEYSSEYSEIYMDDQQI